MKRKTSKQKTAQPKTAQRKTSLFLMSFFSLAGAKGVSLVSGCSPPRPAIHEQVGSTDSALTAAQCTYFAVGGKVPICHRTGSSSHPYSIIDPSTSACSSGHAHHAGDYVRVSDPDCQGGGCLPESAPCDNTVPCCEGFSCTSGTCTANVSNNCSPSPCQNGSTCTSDMSGYTCTCLPGFTGTNCETEIDECASSPCVNGDCLDAVNGYVCECPPGFTGTNCETDIDECASSPCVHGECEDQVNGYFCLCEPGFTGTNCEQPE